MRTRHAIKELKLKREVSTSEEQQENSPSTSLLPLKHRHEEASISSSKRIFTSSELRGRLSPFLIFSVLMPFLFIWLLIKGEASILMTVLFIIIEVNILFIDFALWNYFEGKKKLRIWLIETFALLGSIYFVL